MRHEESVSARHRHAHPDPITTSVAHLSLTCPSSRTRPLTHPQQSVHTHGSRTAPPSSCLQLIKSWRLNPATHRLYQLQIQPYLKLIQPQRSSHRNRLVRTTRPQLPRYPVLATWVTSHLQRVQAQPIDWTRFRHGSNTPKSSCQKILTATGCGRPSACEEIHKLMRGDPCGSSGLTCGSSFAPRIRGSSATV